MEFRLTINLQKKDSILFKGYAHSYPTSALTGLKRLSTTETSHLKNTFLLKPMHENNLEIPDYYIVGQQCNDVLSRLKANDYCPI